MALGVAPGSGYDTSIAEPDPGTYYAVVPRSKFIGSWPVLSTRPITMVVYKSGLSAPLTSGERVVLTLAPRGRKTLTEEIEAGRLPQGVYVATSGAYRRTLRLRAYTLIPFADIAEVASGPNPEPRPSWWRFWSKWSPFVLILKSHASQDVVFEWAGDWKGNTLARMNAVRDDFAAIVSAFGQAQSVDSKRQPASIVETNAASATTPAGSLHRAPIRSSSIRSVGYDPISRTLEIEFVSGALYRYAFVPATVYERFVAAKSLGTFFHQEIEPHYPHQRVT